MIIRKIMLIGVILILLTPISLVTGIYQTDSITKCPSNTYNNVNITELINAVNESILQYYLEKFVSFGPKDTGSDNCKHAAEWIKQELEYLGLYTYYDDWKFIKAKDRNVIGLKNGTNPASDAVIVICAHYDTIGNSPGANDDGSGVAAMLTIANITSNYFLNHTIRFTAVSGEEIGTFGSLADAQRAYKQDENIYAVLSMDMIGNTTSTSAGQSIIMVAPERAEWITTYSEEVAEKYKDDIGISIQASPNYRSDHHSYIDYGYDAVGYVQSNPDQYHWMHKPEDTIDKINFSYLAKGTKLVLATAVELACKPIDVQIRIQTPYEGYIHLGKYPLLRLPGFNLVREGIRGMTYIIGKSPVKVNITTEEEIQYVVYVIDGDVWALIREPPYEWTIQATPYSFFPIRGKHTLSVGVLTSSGKIVYDEMDIFVLRIRW
jgi:hypothetical protein